MSKGLLPTGDVGALVDAYKGYGNALMANMPPTIDVIVSQRYLAIVGRSG